MSDAFDIARKQCPQCGHDNRLSAKICTNCGYAFPAEALLPATGVPLKRCPECGTANRIGAKVCTNCGHQFRTAQDALTKHAKAQKWCPRCGAVCHLDAKVCTNCGHHFRTDFANAAQDQSGTSAPAPDVADPILTESPIVQPLAESVALPQQYEPPPMLPDLPDPPMLAVPDMASPVKPTDTAPVSGNTAPAPITDSGAGEPAPELSDLDFDALRRTSPDHINQRGRVVISLFKKDRS